MILKRYPNPNYIFDMDIHDAMKQIAKMKELDFKDKLYQRWLVDYPRMKEFMNFEDYTNFFMKSSEINVTKTKEQIIKEAEKIRKKDMKRGGKKI